MTSEDSLERAEELLTRLEATRAELERVSESDDAETAIDLLGKLSELAKEVEAELARAKREADAGA
ncbi:MAG: hypothetical protein M3168_03215 [Actinomycetota bacterium]|nr:hypothetical protein [Actinomycetota bacterium]